MPRRSRTEELPLPPQPGVAPLTIPAIDKAVSKYEREKEKRCSISPREVAAKAELKEALHKRREELPVNEDGQHFYRFEGVDYILEEVLKRRAADDGEVAEERD